MRPASSPSIPTDRARTTCFWCWEVAGGWHGPHAEKLPDDVKFVAKLLDDLAQEVNVDRRRVYATGMSNGGMMCYRLAAELSSRIAAIAPVSGTLAVERAVAPRCARDALPWDRRQARAVCRPRPADGKGLAFKSVEETIRTWAKIDGCPAKPTTVKLPHKAADCTTVERKTYGPGKGGAEVILFVIHGGGHTWPGRQWPVPWLGNTTQDISASDLMWEFFQRHPLATAEGLRR